MAKITESGEILCGKCLQDWGRKKVLGRIAEDGLWLYCRGCREEILLPRSQLCALLAPANIAGGIRINQND